MKPDEMDAVFSALASEPRRRILDILKKEPGCNVSRVCGFFDIGRIAVMKHLAVLEAREPRRLGEGRPRAAAVVQPGADPHDLRPLDHRVQRLLGGAARAREVPARERPGTDRQGEGRRTWLSSNKAVFRIVIAGTMEAVFRELTKTGEPQGAVFNSMLTLDDARPGARPQDADAHRERQARHRRRRGRRARGAARASRTRTASRSTTTPSAPWSTT